MSRESCGQLDFGFAIKLYSGLYALIEQKFPHDFEGRTRYQSDYEVARLMYSVPFEKPRLRVRLRIVLKDSEDDLVREYTRRAKRKGSSWRRMTF